MPTRPARSPSQSRRKHLHRGILLRIALVMTALVCASAATLWQLVNTGPAWYEPPVISDERDQLGDRFENRLLQEAQNIRPPDENWTVRVREDHLNAWLANRLLPWIEHEPDMQWPAELAPPQVHITKKGIDVAVDINMEGAHTIVVARLSPRVTEGGIAIDLERIGAGRLMLPGDPTERVRAVVEDLRKNEQISADLEEYLLKFAEGGDDLIREIKLVDDRRLRLLNVVCNDGSVDLTFRTIPGEKKRGGSDDTNVTDR